jgi:hypothetical protein
MRAGDSSHILDALQSALLRINPFYRDSPTFRTTEIAVSHAGLLRADQ